MTQLTPCDEDAEAAGELLRAIVKGYGRGGKTWLAGKLGLKLSAMCKRLRSPGAGLDAVTMRAVLLIEQTRTDLTMMNPALVDGYAVQRDSDGEPKWRPA